MYDEIGLWGITAAEFAAVLAGISGDVTVRLNSPGGSATDGLAMYSLLRQRPGTVRVVVDGLAASIASVIAMAASPGCLAVAPNAALMVHDAFGECFGNDADMTAMAGVLARMSANIASVYADRTGQPVAQWRQAMSAETWYVGQEAVDAGLADSVLEMARA
jgi:ATP-dependent Clp endopeptidase proteolytic subunit ClpP